MRIATLPHARVCCLAATLRAMLLRVEVGMPKDADHERALVDACIELARDRYPGPVRINMGRCSDGMWTVDIVQDREFGAGLVYSDRSSAPATMELTLLARRGAARTDALQALCDSLQRIPTNSD